MKKASPNAKINAQDIKVGTLSFFLLYIEQDLDEKGLAKRRNQRSRYTYLPTLLPTLPPTVLLYYYKPTLLPTTLLLQTYSTPYFT